MTTKKTMIEVRGFQKNFTLHTQGGAKIPVFDNLDMTVSEGELVILHGPSGCGKSTLLRSLYANYKAHAGSISVRHRDDMVDIVSAEPRQINDIRKHTIGYVSQFLRVIPRVSTIDVVKEPLLIQGVDDEIATKRAAELLEHLNVPEALWSLAPATFSGGEQQRVNIARGFAADYPILLLDEPTASLDAANRDAVVDLINTAISAGTAVVGIFHDEQVRKCLGGTIFDVNSRRLAA